jgi:hypothetical protein
MDKRSTGPRGRAEPAKRESAVTLNVSLFGLSIDDAITSREQVASFPSVIGVSPVTGARMPGTRSGELLDLSSFVAQISPALLFSFITGLVRIFNRADAPNTEIELHTGGKSARVRFNPKRIDAAEVTAAASRLLADMRD